MIQYNSLKNERKNTLPVVNLKLAGILVKSLIDTGASATLLDNRIFQQIKNDDRVKKLKIDAQITSVTGGNLEITNCVSLPINIGNKHYQHKIYIVNNPLSDYYDAIIGYDFLKSKKFTICFNTDTIKSESAVINIHDALTNGEVNQTTYAYLPKNVILKAGESRNIELSLNKTIKKGDSIKIFSNLKNQNIKFVNNVCPVTTERQITVNISNLSDSPIPINKNTKIGTISSNFDTRNIEVIRQLRKNELKPSDFNLEHLDEVTKNKLLDLLMEFADIFSKRLYTIGRTEAIQPNLHVDDDKLPSIKPYRIPEALQNEVNRQLSELEAANIIERSNSHISSPLILIKKKNPTGDPLKQKWRLVVDYRKLNAHVKYPRHRLPIIQHLLDRLKRKIMFTTLDLSSSFWQIPLKVKDRDYTTFSSPKGNFRYVTTPQGLNASAEVFADLADQILAPLSDLEISNYIDDFAMGSNGVDEMLHKLRLLFERFRLFGITINPEKCSFMLPEINFLGHKLNAEGIRPIEENIIKIRDFPPPNTVKKIRRFVGLVSYYRKFIKNFSQLSAPLTDLTKKNARFRWTKEAQTSFDILKECLSRPPILIHPDYEKQFVLSADASDNVLGGMLGQTDKNGIIRPIAYFSKKLNSTQKRYTILEKELMSIVCCVSTFKHYLYGRHFLIRCDNKSLTEMSKLECPGNRVARWFTFLADYNYTFEHISSSENIVADILSRDYFDNSVIETKTVTLPKYANANTHETKPKENIKTLASTSTDNVKHVNTMNCGGETQTNTDQFIENGTGLENLGNSCFMNVVLQCLMYLSPLTDYLSHDIINCENTKFCMICSLKRHLTSVVKNIGKVIQPLELYENLTKISTQFRMNKQSDAQEFLLQVICMLENVAKNHTNETLNITSINNPITSLFGGNFQSEIKCLYCNKKSITFELFKNISLAITQEIDSLENSLQRFTNVEYLSDNYRCVNCKLTGKANKVTSISKNPKILTIHFNRFKFSNSQTNKITTFVPYPEKLNIRPYMTSKKSDKPLWYSLNAVIVHDSEITENGHYYCYNKDKYGDWYILDDEKVEKVTIEDVLNKQAYILFYVDMENNTKTYKSELFNVNAIQIDLPTIEDIKLAQGEDKKLSLIISTLRNPSKGDSQNFTDYFIRDGLLLHKASIPRIRKSTKVEQIVVPDKFKPHILTANHLAHFGVLKTYHAIREKYFWQHMYSDTKHFVNSCKQCAAFRSPNKLFPVPLERHYLPSRVNEFISGDYIGPFHKTDKGNQYILTFIDHFSKFIKLYAVPNTTTRYTADCVLEYICTYGIPTRYLTDNASCFTSEVFKYLCEKFSVTKLTTSPQHPSGNGSAEAINKNIKKSLAIFAEETSQWDDFIDYYALIYNNTVHSATNEKPAFIQLGFEPILPTDILNERRPVEHVSHADFVAKKASQLNYVNRKVKENILRATTKQENYQHQFSRYRKFSPGDLVFLNNRSTDRNKLTTKRRLNVGPYEVKKAHNKVDFTIIDPSNPSARSTKVHAQRLIPFTARKPELDLFHSLVQKQHCEIPPQNKKTHAIFDDTPDIEILWPAPSTINAEPQHNAGEEIVSYSPSGETLTEDNNDDSMNSISQVPDTTLASGDDSNETIIYDPVRDATHTSQTYPYDLRQIQPRYDPQRFLQWALDITK